MRKTGYTLDEIFNLGAVGLCKTFRFQDCTLREFHNGGVRAVGDWYTDSLTNYKVAVWCADMADWRVVS
jgi:hypothetical protein